MRQKVFHRCFVHALGLVVATMGAGQALTLQEALERALTQRPDVKIKQFAADGMRQNRFQARSALLPTFTLHSRSDWLDQITLPGATSRFGEAFQHNARISGNQPIFRGGREYFSLMALDLGHDAAQVQVKQAELDVFRNVTEQFFVVLALQAELQALREQVDNLKIQVNEFKNRFQIGRSREAEYVAAQSELARTQSTVAMRVSDLDLAQKQLSWILGGGDVEVLIEPYQALDLKPNAQWAEQLSHVPRVKQKELEVAQARKQLWATRGDFLPSVDFSGNYYLDRSGILSDAKWDLSLSINWVLFSGFMRGFESQKASLEIKRLELEYADILDQQRQEFHQQMTLLDTTESILVELKNAETLAKKNFELLKIEERRGLITNLEVLRALNDYVGMKRDRRQQELNLQRAMALLKIHVGMQP